jgi:hypothetical protein
VAGDPAFSRAPRCAQVERAQHCSCEAGFHLSGAAGGDSICQGRHRLHGRSGTAGGDTGGGRGRERERRPTGHPGVCGFLGVVSKSQPTLRFRYALP